MKKCPYCGKEYPDDVVQCLVDGELLESGEAEPPQAPPLIPASLPPPPSAEVSTGIMPAPAGPLTDQQTRILEVVLICVVAFGSSLLSSTYHFFNRGSGIPGVDPTLGPPTGGAWRWVNSMLHEGSALALLWYILMRRNRTFRDLGLSWAKKDIGWSIFLNLIGYVAFLAVYGLIRFTGFSREAHSTADASVARYLFGGGITIATILFAFLNPFFEELIVRAYLMTEIKHLTNSVSKAILVSTLLQTSYHFYQGAPMALGLGAMFLVYSIYYAKTNRIAPIILAHLYGDVGSTLIYLWRHH